MTEFSDVTVVPAESARVAFVVCEDCGAAILLDPRDKTPRLAQHVRWHVDLEARA